MSEFDGEWLWEAQGERGEWREGVWLLASEEDRATLCSPMGCEEEELWLPVGEGIRAALFPWGEEWKEEELRRRLAG